MNSADVAKKVGLSERSIQEKTKKAKELGFNSIKVGDRYFEFRIVKGHYEYEEIYEEVVEEHLEDDDAIWKRASEEERRLAHKRFALVRAYLNRPDGESWKKFLERVEYRYRDISPSKNKLFRWLKVVQSSEKSKALVALLDKRGKKSSRSYSDEQYEFAVRLWLENPDRRLSKIELFMREEFGDECPSYATIRRMLERFKRENSLVATFAKSPAEANNKLRPAPGSASEHAGYNNAVWEMDGTPVDVMCSDGVRYQLSAAIDVYSRRVVVVVVPRANANSLGRVFKKGILKLGVPEKVVLDNGREYKSNAFAYTCSRLKIEQHFVAPYSGWKKPHIERFFGTLTRDLFEELPGYIGHSVADRAKIQDRESYERKIEARKRALEVIKSGLGSAKKLAKKQKDMDLYIPTTLSREELESRIDRWIKLYERKRHRGIGESPLERWNDCPVPVRRIEDERVLDVLVGLSEKKKVTKKGITWKKISYWSDKLWNYVGQSVWVLSDDDLGYIYVYDLDMNFICKAEAPEVVGKSRSEYLASKFFDKKTNKLARELAELRREAPDRYEKIQQRLADEIVDDESAVSVAFKSDSLRAVMNSSEESIYSKEEKEAIESDEEVVMVNGRPVFDSFYDRFLWDLEHDMVDDDTRRLAEKNERVWQMAYEDWMENKAG